jgi:hypothetical protein
MAEWSKNHMAAIGSLNLKFKIFGRLWLNRRPSGALGWKVDTIGQESRGVVCAKPAPPGL